MLVQKILDIADIVPNNTLKQQLLFTAITKNNGCTFTFYSFCRVVHTSLQLTKWLRHENDDLWKIIPTIFGNAHSEAFNFDIILQEEANNSAI